MDFVKKLEEIEAIKQLKYRYMRSIDQKLWKEMESAGARGVGDPAAAGNALRQVIAGRRGTAAIVR